MSEDTSHTARAAETGSHLGDGTQATANATANAEVAMGPKATEDITAALATFDQGIAAVPKCGLAYNAVARLLIQQGRPAEARTKLETLIKQAPNSDGAVIAKEILASIAAKP